MKGKFIKYDGDLEVEYDITPEKKDLICERLLEYYKKNCCDGEGIHQDDDSIIDAPSVMSDIADNIIKFKQTYKG